MNKPPKGSGYAGCCESCDIPDPRWRLERQGDAAVSWACDSDLSEVVDRMQRENEVTRLVVFDRRKQAIALEMKEAFQKATFETLGRYGFEDSVNDGCWDSASHAQCPKFPQTWEKWAVEMTITHEQVQCPACGYWAIWKLR